jgi:hypothetical protein
LYFIIQVNLAQAKPKNRLKRVKGKNAKKINNGLPGKNPGLAKTGSFEK